MINECLVFSPADKVGNIVGHNLNSDSSSMTEREGWRNYAQPIIIPRNVSKDPVKSRAGPNRRSGHRVFATDDYLYVVGGFNSVGASVGSSTFKDIWKLNLLTNQWTEVKLVGAFADTMASFSLVFVPELDKFYVYGGTGYPFAENVSSNLYECTLIDDDTCKIEKLETTGDEAPRLYGQSMVCRLNYNNKVSLFIVGGTQGFHYNFDVYEFHIDNRTSKAECRKLGDTANAEGCYRHESFIHNNAIYSIGGANDQNYIPLDTIAIFDLQEKKYVLKATLPDDEENFPEVRKGHSLVKYGTKVYIFGGLHYPNELNDPENILDDIWVLDLTTFKWTKSKNTLPEAVFFHSADITSIGQIVSYGGCVSAQPEPVRTQNVSAFFIDAPTLTYLCSRNVYKLNSDLLDRAGHTFSFSSPMELLQCALNCEPGRLGVEAVSFSNDNSAA